MERASPRLLVTMSVVFLVPVLSLSRAGEATQIFPPWRPRDALKDPTDHLCSYTNYNFWTPM